MKRRANILTVVMLTLATVLAGCSTTPDPAGRTHPEVEARPSPIPDVTQAVRLCVITNLVAEHLARPQAEKNFGAFFVRGGPELLLPQGLFDQASPRVELGTNNLFFQAGVVHDRITGKPGMLLFVKYPSLTENGGAATADGWHYLGPGRGGGVRYRLRHDATGWHIMSREKLSEF